MRTKALSLLLLLALLGCSEGTRGGSASDPAVDSAELRKVKDRIGMADCQPGPGQRSVEGGLPDLTLPCLGGGTDLSSLRGPMVLNLWASWCGPCREDMPALETFRQQHGDRVPILGMAVNDLHPAQALTLVEETGATYPSVADPSGEVFSEKAFAFARRGFPAFVFVNGDGTVAGVSSGGVDSASEIEALVAEHLGIRVVDARGQKSQQNTQKHGLGQRTKAVSAATTSGTIAKFSSSTETRNRVAERGGDLGERHLQERRVQQRSEQGIDAQLKQMRGPWPRRPDRSTCRQPPR